MALQNGSNISLPLSQSQGGTGQTSKSAAFDALSPTFTKGQIIVNNGASNVPLSIGPDNSVLTADSTQLSGVKWSSGPTVSYDAISPTKVLGDIPVYGASGNGRLGVGANGNYLIADSSQPLGLKWGTAPQTGVNAITNTDGKITISGTSTNPVLNIAANFLTPISQGGTGQTTKQAAFDALSPNLIKGDLSVNNGSTNTRLPVGSDGQILQCDSTQANGIKWAPPPSAGVSSVSGGTGIISSGGATPSLSIDPNYVAPISGGGTGVSSLTNVSSVLLSGATSASPLTSLANPATTGMVLRGTAAGAPAWDNFTGGTSTNFSGVVIAGASATAAPTVTANNSAPTTVSQILGKQPGGGIAPTWINMLNYSAVVTGSNGYLTYALGSSNSGAILASIGTGGAPEFSNFYGNPGCIMAGGLSSSGGILQIGNATAGYILTSNGAGALPSFKNINAAKADQVAATSTTLYVTPSVQQFHPSAAKVWCRFTVSGAIATLQANFGVTSITRSSVGSFVINFTTAFTTANYASFCNALTTDTTAANQPVIGFRNINVGSIGINSVTVDTATYTDFTEYYFVAYGTQ